MNFKTGLFVVVLIVSNMNLIAQNEVFIDESMKEVSEEQFLKKCEALVLKCLKYSSDSLTVNKIYKRFEFGRLSPKELDSVHSVLRQKESFQENLTAIVVFKDTISGFVYRGTKKELIQKLREKSPKKYQNRKTKFIVKGYTPKLHKKEHNKRIKKIEKCKEILEAKYNATSYYIYKYDKGHYDYCVQERWFKDNGAIKNMFFKYRKDKYLLVLKPDGEYFLSSVHLSDNKLHQLLNTDTWEIFKGNLKNSIITRSKEGIGFFKKEKIFTRENCY